MCCFFLGDVAMKYVFSFLFLLLSSFNLYATNNAPIEIVQALAEQGDAKAQFMLAEHYHEGFMVDENKSLAVAWYQKAAEQGHKQAQFSLATAYDIGEGVSQDLHKAAQWYEKAAMQGEGAAAYNLGIMYDEGAGFAVDKVKASTWLLVALALKNDLAESAWQQSSLLLNQASRLQAEQDARQILQNIQHTAK